MLFCLRVKQGGDFRVKVGTPVDRKTQNRSYFALVRCLREVLTAAHMCHILDRTCESKE